MAFLPLILECFQEPVWGHLAPGSLAKAVVPCLWAVILLQFTREIFSINLISVLALGPGWVRPGTLAFTKTNLLSRHTRLLPKLADQGQGSGSIACRLSWMSGHSRQRAEYGGWGKKQRLGMGWQHFKSGQLKAFWTLFEWDKGASGQPLEGFTNHTGTSFQRPQSLCWYCSLCLDRFLFFISTSFSSPNF